MLFKVQKTQDLNFKNPKQYQHLCKQLCKCLLCMLLVVLSEFGLVRACIMVPLNLTLSALYATFSFEHQPLILDWNHLILTHMILNQCDYLSKRELPIQPASIIVQYFSENSCVCKSYTTISLGKFQSEYFTVNHWGNINHNTSFHHSAGVWTLYRNNFTPR